MASFGVPLQATRLQQDALLRDVLPGIYWPATGPGTGGISPELSFEELRWADAQTAALARQEVFNKAVGLGGANRRGMI